MVSLRRTELRQPVGVLFSRCKPRFSTSYGRYARAKWAYVGAMIVTYMAFSLVPELFNKVANIGAGDDLSKTNWSPGLRAGRSFASFISSFRKPIGPPIRSTTWPRRRAGPIPLAVNSPVHRRACQPGAERVERCHA